MNCRELVDIVINYDSVPFMLNVPLLADSIFTIQNWQIFDLSLRHL